MKRNYWIILIFLVIVHIRLCAQTDEFIINEIVCSQSASFVNQCRTPGLGTIIFASSIPNITFKIQNDSSSLKSQIHNFENNQYILCVKPTEEDMQYQIVITCKNFKREMILISSIQASECRCYTIDSKNEPIKQELDKNNHIHELLKDTLKTVKQIDQTVKKRYNYLSFAMGNGVSYVLDPGLGCSLNYRTNGIIGWGIQGGVGWGTYKDSRETYPGSDVYNLESDYVHYSIGVKCYPFQGIKQRGSFSFQDVYIMLSYGNLSVRDKKKLFGQALSTGGDWMIPCLTHPDGGIIINLGLGAANSNKIYFVYDIGLGFYVNL